MLHASFGILALVLTSMLIELNGQSPQPVFPLQFSATISITAHLIDENQEYPPRHRQMSISYDYVNKRARAEIEAGYEAAKVYIRRYDDKKEYMIRLPPINDCKRSYLGEVMPFPDISDSIFIRNELIGDQMCQYFLHEDFETRIHIYMSLDNGAPVRLIQESTEDGVSTALLTYDYLDVDLGPPPAHLFEIPSPYTHDSCVRHAGGFPYLHIFHYFAKF